MGLGRRKVSIHDARGWVFNRMADVYSARPAYPDTLVDALSALTRHSARPDLPWLDVGAGIGHLALPLAQRGHAVWAVEPASAMLDVLRARVRDSSVQALHGAAEALPVPDTSVGAVVIADALHFLDAHRAGSEIARVLVPGGLLALVLCELSATAFMESVIAVMEEAAPRRPRAVTGALSQVAGVAGVALSEPVYFRDDSAVDGEQLMAILRSISFIGPAMNPARAAAFRTRILALPGPRVWSRSVALYTGIRA